MGGVESSRFDLVWFGLFCFVMADSYLGLDMNLNSRPVSATRYVVDRFSFLNFTWNIDFLNVRVIFVSK